ncbi:MAG: hypothetical protein ACLP5H_32980 [Desulfomonilaceae bacterium]
MQNSNVLSSEVRQASLTVAKRGDVLIAALDKIPAEAIISVVDLVADVVRANKTMEGRSQEFEQTLVVLREKNMDRKERMATLSSLLRNLNLNDDAQMKLVDSICRIAEGI